MAMPSATAATRSIARAAEKLAPDSATGQMD